MKFIQDKTGTFWFGTDGGICTYNGQTFTILKDEVGKNFSYSKSIMQDRKGNVWVGSNFGLWRYDGTTFTKVAILNIADVIEDKNGNVWTCSLERGFVLSRFEAVSLNKRTTIAETENSSQPILSVFEDSAGAIWFGAFGLYRYDGKTITHFVP
ncbi:MAG: two-component regulator propeller domain-containing protein [Chryseolinea sp.]